MNAELTEPGPKDRRPRVIVEGLRVLAWVRSNAPTAALGWQLAAACLEAALTRFAAEKPGWERRCANPNCRQFIARHYDLESDLSVWPRQLEGRAEFTKAAFLRERMAPAVAGFCSCMCWQVTDPDTLPPHRHDTF